MRKQVDEVNQKADRAQPGPGDVFERIHTILHLYRARQQRGLREGGQDEHGLAHMETKALGYFARRPGATQSDLVAHSGRDKAQVARLIRGLRERGLLTETKDEHDRRSTRLGLSDAGREAYEALHRHDGTLAAAALAGIDAAELANLLAALDIIRKNLESC